MKASMPSLVGNRSLRSRLCNDILNRTMAHAYVLAGPRGSGKHTIAMQYAAAIACERKDDANAPLPCGVCPSCRKILEKKSPDVITVEKDGQSVKVEQIRNLQTDVRKVPNDLDDKFYIIEDADTMTTQYIPAPEIFLAGAIATLLMFALIPILRKRLGRPDGGTR